MSRKVLVVDDESDARQLLKTYFETSGFDVCEAEDGYEAVQKALDERPDLVIMDMAMPLVDGVNSARAMRSHDELRDTPIIGLTGFGTFYEPRALEAGCTDMISKPVDFKNLEPVVKRHLDH